MKKQLLLALFALCIPWSAWADVEIDGIYYNLITKTKQAEVTNGGTTGRYSGNIVIPASVTNGGKTYTVVAIDEGAFQNATGLTAISIPSSVTSIGDNAFDGCGSLKSVTIAWETPIVINSTIFPNSGNATLHVPSGSESAYASADCWKDFKTIAEPIVFVDYAVKTLCLANWDADGDGVLYMDEAALVTDLDSVFTDNTDITTFDELQYFTGLTSIGERAFYYCSNLTSIVIPDNVTTIGNRAFYVCSGLTSLHISANVRNIEDRAFAYCSGLKSIVVDDGNTVYDSRNDCNALIKTSNNTLLIGCKNTVIPSGVKILAEGSFRGCAELKNIEIPEGVTTIGASAFRGCTGLESVTLPSTITSIGTYAFSAFDEVYNLTTVTVEMATPVTITSSVFPNRINSTLYVPKGTKGLYEAAEYWKEFKDIVEIEEEPTIITTSIEGFNRGLYVTDITCKVTSQEGLTCQVIDTGGSDVVEIPSEIYESMLEMSYQITSIAGISTYIKVLSLPSTITSISDTAFYKCNKLKAVIANMEEPCPIASTTFANQSNIILYVPLGCKAKYEAMNYWKEFKEILELAEIDSGIYYLQNVEEDTILWNKPFYISKKYYDRYDMKCVDGYVENSWPYLLRGSEYGEYGEYVCDVESIYIGEMDREGGGWTVTVDGENTYRIQSFLRDNVYGAAMFPLGTFLGFVETNLGFYNNEANIHWKLLPYNDVQRQYLRQYELPIVIQTASQLGIDTTDADRLYHNESANADEVEEAIRVLRELSKNKLHQSGASYGNPVELTGLIQNPSFAWGSDYGWKSSWDAFLGGHDFSSFECNYWSARFNQYQTITGIANGLYQVKVLSNFGDNGYLYANNDSTKIISDSISNWHENTLIVNVIDSTLSIGVVCEDYVCISFDNFQLYYLGQKDQLYSTNMTAHIGSQTSIPVMLVNEKEFGGLKFLLSLPEGVTLSEIEKTERLDNTIQVTFDKVSDNNYQVILFNMSRKSILGNEGELLMLKVNLRKDMEVGKHEIQMSEIVASDLDLNEIELADSRCTLNVENNIVVITDISDMDNAFYMDEKSVVPGNRYVLPIKLKNNQLVMGYQFDLELPEGVSFALDDNGRVIATMSDRGSTFSISKNKRSDRVCRFVVMDASNNVLTGEDGVVMNVTVDVADNIEVGVYGVVFKNGELTTKEDNAISSILLRDVTAPMNVVAALMGDVNNDGRVSVTDVVAIVGYILGNKFTNFVKAAADLNGDGSITVVDVVSVINLILNDDSYSKANGLFEVEEE